MQAKPIRLSVFSLLSLLTLAQTPGSGSQANPATPVNNAAATAPNPSDYRIGEGDVLQVDVWKEPEASVSSALVRSDGKISLPIVKEVEATGLTPAELEKVLTTRFRKYINGAEVTVVVKEIHSKVVYLVGAVKKEGSIQLRYPMTVLQVLAEAGGITEYAKRKKMYVLRPEGGKQVRLPFNYSAVVKGEHMEQNLLVQPGDTIVVPQ